MDDIGKELLGALKDLADGYEELLCRSDELIGQLQELLKDYATKVLMSRSDGPTWSPEQDRALRRARAAIARAEAAAE